uniref:Uncharacterized protein n=1 Tax=Populus trichocarpa TaxID=3694 RepID=B9GL10_POPTR
MEVSMYMSNPVRDAGKAQMAKLNKKSGAAQQTLFKRAVEMKKAKEENTQRIPLRQEAGERLVPYYLGEMWFPDRIYGYVRDRQDEPDKVALVLLLQTEKARQKGGRGR